MRHIIVGAVVALSLFSCNSKCVRHAKQASVDTVTVESHLIHPDSLKYPTLPWKIPTGDPYREELENGIPLYMAVDSTLPIFTLRLSFRAGTLYEKDAEKGLSLLHALTLRNGGSEKSNGSEIDSLLDFHALSLAVSAGADKTDITISGLSKYFPVASGILRELLLNPAFSAEKFEHNKDRIENSIRHRFDNPGPVLKAGWSQLVYPKMAISELLTVEHIEAISQKKLGEYHNSLIGASEVMVGFAGAVDGAEVKYLLDSLFPKERIAQKREMKKVVSNPQERVVIIHKDINQAYIKIGLPSFQRPDSRYYPVQLFNEILGGGGFTSRLVKEVRSNAGLTYSIRSALESNYHYKGCFTTTLFTKSESINHALFLTNDVIEKTIAEKLDSTEIHQIKEQYISALPSYFRTSKDIVFTYLTNEFDGRSPDHFTVYPQKLRDITLQQIENDVAEVIRPDDFITLIVGDTTALFAAESYNGFSLKELHPTILTEEDLL